MGGNDFFGLTLGGVDVSLPIITLEYGVKEGGVDVLKGQPYRIFPYTNSSW